MRSHGFISLFALSLTFGLLLHASCFSQSSLVAAQDAGSSSTSSSPGAKTVTELLKEGTTAMASGRLAAAIGFFDEAIQADPTAYLSYYRRATAELSMGRTSAALEDLDTLLKLKPDFAQAHFTRANVLTKEGELNQAVESIQAFLKHKKDDAKGTELKTKIALGMAQLKIMSQNFEPVEKAMKAGKRVVDDQKLRAKAEDCIKAASEALKVSPNHMQARSSRAECRLALGNLEDAITDWSGIVSLAPSLDLLLRLSSLKYYVLGDNEDTREAGMAHLKACLSSDPDNRQCARAHRRLRTIEKQLKKATNFAEGGNWRPVISALKGAKAAGPTVMESVEEAIKDDQIAEEGREPVLPPYLTDAAGRSGLLHHLRQLHCRAHTELNELKKAKPYCEAVLAREPSYAWALVARADEAMKEEKYEEAMRDYRTALESAGGQDQAIQTRLQKAQRLHKQANTKDYYKVLGVSRDADAATLKKAYRKMAREHHPDKGGSAEKMAQINEAFDVLGDEDKRRQFDQGIDPNDPMGGQQGYAGNPFVFQQGGAGGNPFAQFFQGGGGGGGGGGQQFFQQSGGGGGQHFFKQGAGGGQRFSFNF